MSLVLHVSLFALAIAGCMTPSAAGAEDPPAAEPPVAEKPKAEYKPPPEFRTRRRGDKVVYCQKVSIEGSRLTTERCYDEGRLRDLLMQRELGRREIDQRRRIRPEYWGCKA
ncbi:MAG: hypothetical protein ACREVI_08230 [Steroidobacteraceae bacterium]